MIKKNTYSFYHKRIRTALCAVLCSVLTAMPAFATGEDNSPTAAASTTVWTKASEIMQDVYSQIISISTVTAVVCAAVALLLMNFSKNGKTVDDSRAWLKRIAITWAILNGLGFIMAYVTITNAKTAADTTGWILKMRKSSTFPFSMWPVPTVGQPCREKFIKQRRRFHILVKSWMDENLISGWSCGF